MMLHRHGPKIEVVVQNDGLCVQHLPLRPIKHCVPLHVVNGVARSSIASLPPLLHGLYYSPAQQLSNNPCSNHIVVKPHQLATLYVLWPVLQEPPRWLLGMFELVRGEEVGVRWSFGIRQRVYLNLGNLRKAYEQQPMLVWRLRKTLKPGADIMLPAVPPPDVNISLPWFDYVLCVRPKSARLANVASTAAELIDKLLCNMGLDPATCPLQDIYAALEEGTYDPTALSPEKAESLLKRVMLAVDYDLLTLLVKNGIGECCTQPCLQLLLEYAQLEGLPRFAELVVQQTKVELTTQLLMWLVQELLTSGAAAGLEQLLVAYCMERRNPLSAVAAIEKVLLKVAATGSSQQQEAATALSGRFHGAKHALLQQLLYFRAADSETTSLGAQGNQDVNKSNCAPMETLVPQRPLLELLHLCFDEKSGKAIGRGSHAGSTSIHDSSPYAAAVRLADADFLSLAPVVEYTERVWQGTELHTMLGLLIPDGSHITKSTSRLASLRKLRAAFAPIRAAIAFKVQAQPADVHGNCSPAPGPDPGAAGSLSMLEGGHRLKSKLLIRSGDGATSSSGMPEATMLPKTFLGTTAVDNDQSAHQRGSPRPCAEAMEHLHIAAGHMRDCASNSHQDIGTQQSILSSHSSGPDSHSRPPVSDKRAAISSACWLDPYVGLDLLRNMGLAGDGPQPLACVASTAMHAAILAPRAFYNSARGRWLKRCCFELLFLVWYQVSVMGLMPPGAILLVLPAAIVGNLVDAIFQLVYKYKGSFAVCLSDAFVQLNLLVSFGLLAVIICLSIYIVNPDQSTFGILVQDMHINLTGQKQVSVIEIVGSAFAVVVWVHALGIVIPANARLGAMLVTVRRAVEEAAAMIPLIFVLVIGFATSLTVAYQHAAMPQYSTLLGAMRMLLASTGGTLDLLWFERAGGGNKFLAVWGQVLMICYVIVVDILIMTLLIAVINYSYHPVIISQQTVVNYAQTVQHYSWQCRHGIAGPPTNVLQLLLLWLPHGSRKRILPTTTLRWWIPPLDGYVPTNAAEAPDLLLATGPAEAGYLAFLATMYPIMAITAVVALLLHTPLAVLHFAVKGHMMWLDSSLDAAGDEGKNSVSENAADPITQHRHNSLEAAADMAAWSPASPTHNGTAQHTEAPAHVRRKSVLLVKRASLVLGRDAAPYLTTGSILRRSSLSSGGGAVAHAGFVPVRHPGAGWRRLYDIFLVRALQTVWFAVEEPLATCWHVLFAVMTGLLVQLLLVLVLAMILAWAWVTRVLFSAYCMLPSASDPSCSLQLVRYASLWSKADVQAAFAAADNVTSQLQAEAAAEHNSLGLYRRRQSAFHSSLVVTGDRRSSCSAEAASDQEHKHAASKSASQLGTQNPAVERVLIGPFEYTGTMYNCSAPHLDQAGATMSQDTSAKCGSQESARPSSTASDSASGLVISKACGGGCGFNTVTAASQGPAAQNDPAAGDHARKLIDGMKFIPDTGVAAVRAAVDNDADGTTVTPAALSQSMSDNEEERHNAVAAQSAPRSRSPGSKLGVKKGRGFLAPAVPRTTGRSAAALSPYAES